MKSFPELTEKEKSTDFVVEAVAAAGAMAVMGSGLLQDTEFGLKK